MISGMKGVPGAEGAEQVLQTLESLEEMTRATDPTMSDELVAAGFSDAERRRSGAPDRATGVLVPARRVQGTVEQPRYSTTRP